MNLLYNDYQKIKQDNKDENARLKPENRKAIERMTEYISYNKVSLFQLEVIKKDLIGLAMEAEEEGVSLMTKVGMGEKGFCDSLMEDAMRTNKFERILLLIRNLSLVTCVLTMYLCVSTGFPEKFGLITSCMVSATIFSVILELIGFDRFVGTKTIYGDRKTTAQTAVVIALMYIIYFKFDFPIFDLIYGDSKVITGITILVTAIIFLLNSFYWNKQSEKYNWK